MLPRRSLPRPALAVGAGALVVLSFPNPLVPAFPPLGGWIAYVALAPLLVALRGASARRAALLGLLAGIAMFLAGLYWVPHSMIHFGGIASPAAVAILFALVAYLSLYPALFAFVWVRFSPASVAGRIFAAAALWTALEWARSHALSGFGWLSLGYSQAGNPAALALSALVSVYGVSFVLVAVSAAVAEAYRAAMDRGGDSSQRRSGVASLGFAILAAAVLQAAGFAARAVPSGSGVKVGVVQPNIAQDRKWVLEAAPDILKIHLDLSEQAVRFGAQLVVWPESSFPFRFGSDMEMSEPVHAFVRRTRVPLLIGSDEEVDGRYYNSAYLLTPERPEAAAAVEQAGVWIQKYRKIHLLPFGEYIPWWAIKFLPGAEGIATGAGAGGFTAGDDRTVLHAAGLKLAVLICYESAFPGEVAAFAARGADVLVNVTNDAWFGTTAGPYQHAAILAVRAAENRLPLVRSANTGISGFADRSGRWQQRTAMGTRDVRIETVPTGSRPASPFRGGEAVGLVCLATSLIWILTTALTRTKV